METLTKSTFSSEILDQQYISTIRFLSDRGVTPGVQTTTVQLGGRFANDVGMAIALLK